jgi:hypothetical protein
MNRETKRKMQYRTALHMYLLNKSKQINTAHWANPTGQFVNRLKKGIMHHGTR